MTAPLKIRASATGKLMTNPVSKADKEAGNLSEGAKTYIRELWIEKNYNRRREFTNKYVEKGLLNEEKCIDMISIMDNELYEKNENAFVNEYITGVPDIITPIKVIDAKAAFDLWTFISCELTIFNEWQMRCYLELVGRKQGQVIYCLTNSPEATIQRELKSAQWKLQTDDVSDLELQLRRELCFDDIPDKKRIKVFEVTHEPNKMASLYEKIQKAREYYDQISL